MRNPKSEIKIIKWIVLLPVLAVIITSLFLINIFISSKYEVFNNEIKELEKSYIIKSKDKIKQRIDHLSILLDTNYTNQIKDYKNRVKNIVDMGHTMLDEIYKNNKDLSKEELYKVIHEKMKDVRFFDNKSGYFFIWDLEDGTSISLPSAPQLIGTSLLNLKDKKGKRLFDSYKKILDENSEGFDNWFWYKPGSKVMLEKVGYIKKLETLNIGIGTAVYIDDIKEDISKRSIDFINKLAYIDESYIFIIDSNNKVLTHKDKTIINKPFDSLDKKIQENILKITKVAKVDKNNFIEYNQSKELDLGFSKTKKISYVKHFELLDWVMGTGVYTGNLKESFVNKKLELETRLNKDIKKIILVSVIVSLLIIVFLFMISKKIKNLIDFYAKELNETNKKLKKLNLDLEGKVESQVSDIRQKDLILNQQSKLAAMGEMLGNIAHQWRQPLSAISIVASGIRVKKSMGEIDDEQLDKDLLNIVNSTKMLSNTIDDFSNFYSNKKELASFNIDEAINQVLSLVLPNLKNKNIVLEKDIVTIEVLSYKNELIQAILNIINNSKDALQNIEEPRLIKITTKQKEDVLVIELLDNAGGIKEEIINRVFEPYFTTKFKSKGTGIGLYMTKKIIEDSLNGKIEVENKKFELENKEYTGALFTIEIPNELKD